MPNVDLFEEKRITVYLMERMIFVPSILKFSSYDQVDYKEWSGIRRSNV